MALTRFEKLRVATRRLLTTRGELLGAEKLQF